MSFAPAARYLRELLYAPAAPADAAAERERIAREIARIEEEIARLEAELAENA